MDITPEQFQEFIQKVLGPEVKRPIPGLNNAQMYADEQGISYDEAKAIMSANRKQAGERHQLQALLNSLGFGFEDLGLQDKQELGRSAFNTDRLSGKMGFRANGWEYDWQSGKKRDVITSDKTARDRWVPITEGEKAQHLNGQKLSGMGFKTLSQQLAYNRAKAAGQDISSPNDIQKGTLQLTPDEIAKIIGFAGDDGLDPSQFSTPMTIRQLMANMGISGIDTSGDNLITHVGGVPIPPPVPPHPDQNNPGLGFNNSGVSGLGFGAGLLRQQPRKPFNRGPEYDPGVNSFTRGPKGKGTIFKLAPDRYGKQEGSTGIKDWENRKVDTNSGRVEYDQRPQYQAQPRRRPRPGFGAGGGSANPLSGAPMMGFGAGPRY